MEISRSAIPGPGYDVPCIIIAPAEPRGAAVIAHGYGGCKEEQLGLAWRAAEAGVAACVIDLRGHGEHALPLDDLVLADFELAIRYCRRYGKVAAVGHSLGGRLALISSADFAIGISPPLDLAYSIRTQEALRKIRSHRVRPDDPEVVFEALKKIPLWESNGRRNLIIFGSRDVQEIVDSCERLRCSGENVLRIDNALHGDTYLADQAFQAVARQLADWFGDR